MMVRRPPLTVDSRFHSQTSPSVVFCRRQIGTGAGFSQKIEVCACQYHSTAHSFISLPPFACQYHSTAHSFISLPPFACQYHSTAHSFISLPPFACQYHSTSHSLISLSVPFHCTLTHLPVSTIPLHSHSSLYHRRFALSY